MREHFLINLLSQRYPDITHKPNEGKKSTVISIDAAKVSDKIWHAFMTEKKKNSQENGYRRNVPQNDFSCVTNSQLKSESLVKNRELSL